MTFLEECKEQKKEFEHKPYKWAAAKFNNATTLRKCSCGEYKHYSYIKNCQCTEFEVIPDPVTGSWLPLPGEMNENFVSAPYAYGEAMPKANVRVLEDELEDGWLYYGHPGFTNDGGLIIFNPDNKDALDFFSNAWGLLNNYPILSEQHLSEVELEMWEEHFNSWLYRELLNKALKKIKPDDDSSNHDWDVYHEIKQSAENDVFEMVAEAMIP